MELRHYFAIVRHRLVIVVLCLIAGAGGAYISAPNTAIYQARSTIYVGVRSFNAYDPGLFANVQVAGIDRIITTFAEMIDSRPIAEKALSKTHAQRSVDGVLAATTAKPEVNTQLIRVVVQDPDPAVAEQLANAMASSFVDQIESFEPGAAPQAGDVPQLPANVFENASLPNVPQASGVTRRVVLGALFGLAAAVGIALLLEYLDVTVKDQVDAERRFELPILAVIPFERTTAPSTMPERPNVSV
jgi:capsular polysaccharide biosynthesis protein